MAGNLESNLKAVNREAGRAMPNLNFLNGADQWNAPLSRLRIFLAALFIGILISSGAPAQTAVKINSPEYAEQVITDKQGYKHWKIEDVWYSNAPLKVHTEHSAKLLSKASWDTVYYEDVRMNPFYQPNDSNLVWYGSGDLNGDKQRTQSDLDSILAKSGPADLGDIDGDGNPFTSQDYNLLQNFIEDIFKNIPGDWNMIGYQDNYQEKLKSWFDKTIAIDKTDTITYRPEFQCWGFGNQAAVINHYGLGEIAKDSSLIEENGLGVYDFSNNGRFNMPVFYVTISSDATGLNHVIIGGETNYENQGPLDFPNWSFKEPQDDSDVKPGDYSMPNDSRVRIYHSYFYDSPAAGRKIFLQEPFIEFQLTDGVPELIKHDDRLILERPYINSIKPNKSLLEKFVLNQNYPNPFNSQTKIKYSIPLEDKIKLQVYDLQGKLIKTLVNEKQKAGQYQVNLNASDISSGIYIYKLSGQNSGINKTGKMTILK